jgi:hypothetical protein
MLSLFNKKKELEITSKESDGRNIFILPERDEETTGAGNKPILEAMNKATDVPIFKGVVENAYESDFLGYKDKCPLCQTPTQQMYSNFIWANQEAARLMAAPAGHFCPKCPTVIIDDDIMQVGINKARFLYWGTVGIDAGVSTEKDAVNLFKTFNGIKPTYILDENGGLGGIFNSVHQPSGQKFGEGSKGTLASLQRNASNFDTVTNSQNTLKDKIQKAKSKKKNKQAKQSRKANRKK